jgi:hypothetical protein
LRRRARGSEQQSVFDPTPQRTLHRTPECAKPPRRTMRQDLVDCPARLAMIIGHPMCADWPGI